MRAEVVGGLAGLALLGLLLPTTLATGVAAIAVGLLVVVIGWARALRRSVDVEVDVAQRWTTGERGPVTVTVRNTSRWPAPRVRVELRLGGGGVAPNHHVFELGLAGRQARRLQVEVEAQSRGRWRAPRATVRLGDAWGLIELDRSLPALPDLLVLPTVVPVRRLRLPNAAPVPELLDQASLLEDPTAIVGVRPYRPGDPLRTIHWPATAAGGSLVRREVERAQAREVLVVLDTHDDAWRGRGGRSFEAAVTVAASVLVDAVHARQPAGLLVSLPAEGRGGAAGVARFPTGGGRHHLDAMLAHLAGVRRHRGVDLVTLLTRHAPRAEPGTTIVVVSHQPDVGARARLLSLRSAGLTPALVEVADPSILRTVGGTSDVEVVASRLSGDEHGLVTSRVRADRPLPELVL